MVKKICICLSAALMSVLVYVPASYAQPKPIQEMHPKAFGRDFNEKDAAEYLKMAELLNSVDWDWDKLTAKQQEVAGRVGVSEVSESYWETVGGGCSWYCGGGPDSVTASSHLKPSSAKINYVPGNIHDFSCETAWVEGAPGQGIGEYVTFYFKPTAPRITKVIVVNGYVKSEKAFRENSRVKRLKMYIDNKPVAILNLEDSRREQYFEFEPIGKRYDGAVTSEDADKMFNKLSKLPQWTLKFEILGVYPGDKYEDAAISEIYFDGIDVHCFAAGTKVLMKDNSQKNIELIREGDWVKSYDFEGKKLMDAKVAKLVSVAHASLLKLKFADAGSDIITTADHPFWTESGVWAAVDAEKANNDYRQKTKVERLKIGDNVFMPEKNAFLKIANIERIDKRQMTHTIEILGSDNFIANGVLVKTEVPVIFGYAAGL